MSSVQTYCHLYQIGPTYRRQLINPRYQHAARIIICKAWKFPVEYPNRECEHDIKESKGNMLNPIFKENVRIGNIQGVAHMQNQNYLVTESKNV